MIKDQGLEGSNDEVVTDKSYAQLLIELSPPLTSYDGAKKIIEQSGVQIIGLKYLSPQCILLKLDVRDMRNIALKLIDHGYFIIKGVNAALE